MGFDVVLPGSAALYLVLGDPQGLVDGLRLVGTEDAAPVRDERLGRSVPFHGGVEDRKVGGRSWVRDRALARIALEWLSSTEITYALPPTAPLFT
ncbi:MAG: hypothetical protein M3R38_17150 [Actinomycetota bacterium]|nr:hypothetical protein [Actinomycetota bacterium]